MNSQRRSKYSGKTHRQCRRLLVGSSLLSAEWQYLIAVKSLPTHWDSVGEPISLLTEFQRMITKAWKKTVLDLELGRISFIYQKRKRCLLSKCFKTREGVRARPKCNCEKVQRNVKVGSSRCQSHCLLTPDAVAIILDQGKPIYRKGVDHWIHQSHVDLMTRNFPNNIVLRWSLTQLSHLFGDDAIKDVGYIWNTVNDIILQIKQKRQYFLLHPQRFTYESADFCTYNFKLFNTEWLFSKRQFQ